MSKIIGTPLNLPGSTIQGTPQEVAEKLFTNVIFPATEMLSKEDAYAAMDFAFHIMALSVSQFSECVSTADFKKNMDEVVNKIELITKRKRGELSS